MKILSALKPKKRYLVFEIISEENKFSGVEVKKEVNLALLSFVGQLGVARAEPIFLKFNGQKFILKVNHKYVGEAKAALALVKKIKNKKVIIKSIITTGTIKKAKEFLDCK